MSQLAKLAAWHEHEVSSRNVMMKRAPFSFHSPLGQKILYIIIGVSALVILSSIAFLIYFITRRRNRNRRAVFEVEARQVEESDVPFLHPIQTRSYEDHESYEKDATSSTAHSFSSVSYKPHIENGSKPQGKFDYPTIYDPPARALERNSHYIPFSKLNEQNRYFTSDRGRLPSLSIDTSFHCELPRRPESTYV